MKINDLCGTNAADVYNNLGTDYLTLGEPRTITWDALVPANWDPFKEFKGMDMQAMGDADPRAMAFLKRMRDEKIDGTLYSHPIGLHGHGAGALIAGLIERGSQFGTSVTSPEIFNCLASRANSAA